MLSEITIIVKNQTILSNMKILSSLVESLVKNLNFGQKSKFWSKIEILVKNRNFGQKSKFRSKIENLFKNIGENQFLFEIEPFVVNRNLKSRK